MQITNNAGEIVLSIPSEDRYIYLLDLVVSYVAKEMEFDEETIKKYGRREILKFAPRHSIIELQHPISGFTQKQNFP